MLRKASLCLMCTVVLSGAVRAEEPVNFVDPNLKAAVEDALWILDPTPTDMLGLASLSAGTLGITDLTGLEYATNLRDCFLRLNGIADIGPLAGLTNLESLILHRNEISDLCPLSGLTRLRVLNLDYNHVSDISFLVNLTKLSELSLACNQVIDVSPLLGMTSLTYLNLDENPLTDESYDVYIPQIVAHNPGLALHHDRGPYTLTISAGPGGSIVEPGVGEFTVNSGEQMAIVARPDPGFTFAGFTGTVTTTANPLYLQLDGDYSLVAYFERELDVLYVDSRIMDSLVEDGTAEHPFRSIQEAIAVARKDADIVVRPGEYRENLNLRNRNVHLTGFDPDGAVTATYPVLHGGDKGTVITVNGLQDANCVIEGFVITGGYDAQAGAIACSHSSPTFAHCLIVGNRSSYPNGAAVHCVNSNARFNNCTCVDNYAGQNGIGLRMANSDLTVTNSILWGNGRLQIVQDSTCAPSITYCDIQDKDLLAALGVGNLDSDPLFVRRGSWVDRSNPAVAADPEAADATWSAGDYHVRSQAGRWNCQTCAWVPDSCCSPCIDAGDPAVSVGQESSPNGGITNLGAYGGTPQASKTLSIGN